MLLVALVAGVGLWLWLGKGRRRRVPAQWLGIAGTLIGAVLAAKGMPVAGALVATASGLWLRYGGSLLDKAGQGLERQDRTPMDRSEAADLLGVPADADRETVLAAHRRLIARNHPDTGGSAGLAARINAARDLLLKSQDRLP